MELAKFMAKLWNKILLTIFYSNFQLCSIMHTYSLIVLRRKI